MRIRYVSGTLGMFFTLFSNAQVVSDTIKRKNPYSED